jgi:predicted nucleic acid-binding protein
LEAEAKLYIQGRVKDGTIDLVWSYILDIENDQNPFQEKKSAIAKWKRLSVVDIEETESLKERANSLVASGINAKDALHVSAAIEGKADFFITTDDKLLKKLAGINGIRAANPIDIAGEIDEYDH